MERRAAWGRAGACTWLCLFCSACTVLLEGTPKAGDGSEDAEGEEVRDPDAEDRESEDSFEAPTDPIRDETNEDSADAAEDEGDDAVEIPDAACEVLLTLADILTNRDTYIDQFDPTAANGALDNLWTSRTSSNIHKKILVAFDLSTVPAGSVIASAELVMYCTSWSGDVGGSVGVYEVTSAWVENTVTWDSAPTASEEVLDSTVIDLYADNGWDITGLVRQWHAGSRPNHGVMLYCDAEYGFTFASQENIGSEPPRLRIMIEYCP